MEENEDTAERGVIELTGRGEKNSSGFSSLVRDEGQDGSDGQASLIHAEEPARMHTGQQDIGTEKCCRVVPGVIHRRMNSTIYRVDFRGGGRQANAHAAKPVYYRLHGTPYLTLYFRSTPHCGSPALVRSANL